MYKGYKRKLVRVVCDCGNTSLVRAQYILKGITSACGCRNKLPPPTVLDLTGKKFGRLTALSLNKERAGNRKRFWNCICDCGKTTIVVTGALTHSTIRSCGCLFIESNKVKRIKHGMTTTSTYHSWLGMKQRCYNKNCKAYKYYGGRGIDICERWLKSFENFLEDMGEKPLGFTLDRLNSNKSYFKENCRWATKKQQATENKRGLHWVTINNETFTLTEAVKKYGEVRYEQVLARIKLYKWDSVKAITTPNMKLPKKL